VLGEKIKLARKQRGFTLVALGEIVGIKHASLSQIENNVTNPAKRTLISLAKALGDNFGESWLDEHINGTETPKSKKEIVADMTAKEFVSLKMGGKNGRRSKAEIDALTTMLDAELERMKEDAERYGSAW
jgi:transcriptional regulator with XRE-family HTH domain